MFRLSFAVFVALTFPAAILHAEEKEAQSVRFHRPFTVGHLYSFAALGGTHEEVTVRWAGSLLERKERDLQCELAAALRIVEVDSEGLLVEAEFIVFRFGNRDGSKLIPLLEKGTVIGMRRDDSGAFRFFNEKKKPLPDKVAEALDLVIAFDTDNPDPIFGALGPKKPGAKWSVDPHKAAARFAGNGIIVDPEKLGSVVQFKGLDEIAGQPCQMLRAEIRAASANPKLPEGFTATEGTLEVDLEASLPLDASLPRFEEAVHFTLYTVARGQEAEAAIEVETTVSTTVRTRIAKP